MIGKIKMLLTIPGELWELMVCYLPGNVGLALRYRFWKKRLRHLGKGVRFEIGIDLISPEFIEIDDNVWIDRHVIIIAGRDRSNREKLMRNNSAYKGEPGVVHIGSNAHIGAYCLLSGISGGIHISDDCTFSAGCKLYSWTHHYRSMASPADQRFSFGSMVSPDRQCLIEGPVVIGENTGVALNAVILPGTFLPKNCFVRINSVVSGADFTENTIISGDPAKGIGRRFFANE